MNPEICDTCFVFGPVKEAVYPFEALAVKFGKYPFRGDLVVFLPVTHGLQGFFGSGVERDYPAFAAFGHFCPQSDGAPLFADVVPT